MPAAVITPGFLNPADGNLTLIPNTTVPAGEEWKISVRAANMTATDVKVRLAWGTDNNPANAGVFRAMDVTIPANDARDLEVDLPLPAGYRLFARQSGPASSVHFTTTGKKRSVA